MFKRFRKILFSVPSMTVVGITAAYMLLGFLALPALVKWQLEKQIADRGHALQVSAVRFNPLELRVEVDRLELKDAAGKPMFSFAELVVDLQWRSIVDGVWTLADVRLHAPALSFELAKDGRHNFSDLVSRFAGTEPSEPSTGGLASVLVERLLVSQGRIDYADQALESPLVTRVTALNVDMRALSTLREQLANYRVSMVTEAGESIDVHGQLGLDPLLAKGELVLDKLQLSTVARALSRQLALQAAGAMKLSAGFDLSLDPQAAMTGQVRAVDMGITGLSVQVPGAGAPLLAAKTLSLGGGMVDLTQHDVRFARFQLRDGAVALALDAQGRGNWSSIVRAPAKPDTSASAPDRSGTVAAAPESAAWRVAVDDARIDAMAFDFRDTAHMRAVSAAALQLAVSPGLSIADNNSRMAMDKLQLQLSELLLSDGANRLSIPATQLDLGKTDLAMTGAGIDGSVGASRLALARGVTARQGERQASVGATSLATGGLTITGGNARFALEKLQLQLSELLLNDGADTLTIPSTRLDLGKTDLAIAGASINGSMAAPRLALAQGATARQGERQASAGATSLETGGVTITGTDTTTQLAIRAPQWRVMAVSATQERQSARVDEFTGRMGQMTLTSGVDGQALSVDVVALALRGLQAMADGQELAVAALTVDNPSLSLSQTPKGLQLQAKEPVLLLTDVSAQRGEENAKLASLRLTAGSVQLSNEDAAMALSLVALVANGTTLALQRASEGLDLSALALGSDTLRLSLDGTGMRAAAGTTSASVQGVLARQGAHDVALKEGKLQVAVVEASSSVSATGGPDSTQARLGAVLLTLDAVAVNGAGAAAALVGLTGARLAAGDLALVLAQGPLSVTGKAIDVDLEGAVLRDPAEPAVSLLQLGSAALSGAAFNLAERQLSVDKLVLDQASAALWLDAKGQLNLVDRFAGATTTAPPDAPAGPAQTAAPVAAPAPGVGADAAPWRVVVQAAELKNTALGFEDRRHSPPLALGLDGVGVRVSALDTGAATPMQIEVLASLRSGGTLQAQGSVAPLGSAADLQVTASGIALAPVQAVLSEFAELKLASGSASTKGRLLFGDAAGNTARLSYTGGFAVDQLLLEEITPSRPFLAWDTVRSGDLSLTIEPNRLDIGEVQIDKPAGRLIIAADQSINLTDVLKKRPSDDAQAPTAAAAADPAAPFADPFPVTVARIRVADGQLEFADLSLRPQFGTRMHALKGVITGLGTDVNRSAKLQLDARVDQFGSARIRGQVSVFQPEKLTEIDMAFRNLEMKALSPYSAKFAGYEIASGKLSLDLQYKVREGKLLGDNKVVLNQLELGKKVESPDALDVPLDLALAILKDSKGVIDIGLPVRGDLANPEFDYGAVIAKAIGNLLGGIVTAPFRALASLFGGGDTEIDTITFEPGADQLAPPEHQKLETLARALKERPNLKLKVDPVFATAQDSSALQSLLVRSEIVRRMGLEVLAGEDPGPIDAANPRVPPAVEAAFSERYAPQVLAALKERALPKQAPAAAPLPDQAASDVAPGASSAAPAPSPQLAASGAVAAAPGTPVVAAPPPPPAPPPAFYQGLIDRMVKEQAVSDEMLGQLAQRRADAIVSVLTGDNGIAPGRVERGEPRKSLDASDTEVPLKLQLEVAK